MGYKGDACQIELGCPKNCTEHGLCQDSGACECEDGWTGKDCNLKSCLKDCSENGICLKSGDCHCNEDASGSDCSVV